MFYLLPGDFAMLSISNPAVVVIEIAKYIFLTTLILTLGVVFIRSQTMNLLKARKLIKEMDKRLSQLEEQKGDFAYKHKNITDSIIYARRIQDSLIPSISFFEKHFSDSFIIFQPRDIVSGDFYFICERHNKIFVAAADCTGHGVPGALMSMIGLQTLDRIIQNGPELHPNEIMNILSTEVESTFNRDSDGSYAIKDGMEIAICMIDKENRSLEFAGSFLPLYLLRDGNLMEFKGDKYVIGRKIVGQDYTNHQVSLFDDDTIYLFSDGYVDQFGGLENKKFMNRRFRYLLVTIHKYSLADQKTILTDNLLSWMGHNEQVDDVMVVGFRPLCSKKTS